MTSARRRCQQPFLDLFQPVEMISQYAARVLLQLFNHRMVDENGAAVILKNNVPRYILMEFSQLEKEQQAKDEDILEISKRLMSKNKQAYEVLAK